jgi:hypothetical protein
VTRLYAGQQGFDFRLWKEVLVFLLHNGPTSPDPRHGSVSLIGIMGDTVFMVVHGNNSMVAKLR